MFPEDVDFSRIVSTGTLSTSSNSSWDNSPEAGKKKIRRNKNNLFIDCEDKFE